MNRVLHTARDVLLSRSEKTAKFEMDVTVI